MVELLTTVNSPYRPASSASTLMPGRRKSPRSWLGWRRKNAVSGAITTATSNAAALLKLDDRGVLASGKLADLVVLEGDPTADIMDITQYLDRFSACDSCGNVPTRRN
jgi:cytosine/adenosine deaminase-related metal-dependent hydrolase